MKRFLVICVAALFAFSACGRRIATPAERAGQLAQEAFNAIEAAADEESDYILVVNVATEIVDYIATLSNEQEEEFGQVFASEFYERNDLAGYGIEHTRKRLLRFTTAYIGYDYDINSDSAFNNGIATTMFARCIHEVSEDPAEQAGRFAKELFEILEIGQVYPHFQDEKLGNLRERIIEYSIALKQEGAYMLGKVFVNKSFAYSEEYGYGEDFALEFLTEFVNALDELYNTVSNSEIVGDSVSVAN